MSRTQAAWHAHSADEAAKELQSDTSRGLSGADAIQRLARHGPNALAEAKQRSVLMLIVHQFRSLIVGLLVAVVGDDHCGGFFRNLCASGQPIMMAANTVTISAKLHENR